jgi:hypothetical protein
LKAATLTIADTSRIAPRQEMLRVLSRAGTRLRNRDVEALLDQAGRLLEIAASERLEGEHALVTLATATRELEAARAHLAEVRGRVARLEVEANAVAEEAAALEPCEQLLQEATKKQATVVQELLSESAIDAWAKLTGGLAENGMLPLFKKAYPHKGDFGKGRRKADNLWVGVKDATLDDIQKTGTRRVTTRELRLRRTESESAFCSAQSQAESMRVMMEARRSLAIGLHQEVDYGRQTIAILEASEQGRRNDLESSDGVYFSLAKRLDAIRIRFADTITHATARMAAADTGLRELYGTLLSLDRCPEATATLDENVLWLREAASQLAIANRNAQDTVLTAPIEVGKQAGLHRAVVARDPYFENCFVGVRGISLTSGRTELPLSAWASVSPPEWPFDPLRPEVRVSRVLPWRAEWAPEVFGANALHNWNPFGTWELRSALSLEESTLHVYVTSIRKTS